MHTEVILLEDVQHVGEVGALVRVARGFARNYLLPQQLAVAASQKNKRELEHQKRAANHLRAKSQAAAQALSTKLGAMTLRIARKVGEQDKLFGSVTTHDIEAALLTAGVTLDRRKLELAEPIKTLGTYEVPVRLGSTLKPTIKLDVVAE